MKIRELLGLTKAMKIKWNAKLMKLWKLIENTINNRRQQVIDREIKLGKNEMQSGEERDAKKIS